ncbi:MAG: hypothetical protein WCB50_13165 [Pseudolabrys sp.]|jgi:hypothetical protein
MHILMYFAAVSSALIALLFVTDATLEKGAQPIVTTQRVGLPESHLPNPTQILTSKPAPAPDMASPLVLVAAPKVQAAPELQAVEPAARAARAEALSQNNRVTDRQPPAEFRENRSSPRDFGLSGM